MNGKSTGWFTSRTCSFTNPIRFVCSTSMWGKVDVCPISHPYCFIFFPSCCCCFLFYCVGPDHDLNGVSAADKKIRTPKDENWRTQWLSVTGMMERSSLGVPRWPLETQQAWYSRSKGRQELTQLRFEKTSGLLLSTPGGPSLLEEHTQQLDWAL